MVCQSLRALRYVQRWAGVVLLFARCTHQATTTQPTTQPATTGATTGGTTQATGASTSTDPTASTADPGIYDYNEVCSHHSLPQVYPQTEIIDGELVYRDIRADETHRFSYLNTNVTTMDQPDQYRKLIINLEPCRGVVYLFVRKTRPCYPNPYSCIDSRRTAECEWTHFMTEIDGSRDATPTFFEVPLSSTRYFISVYAKETASYTLMLLADIGALPRPGNRGRIEAKQLAELQVQLIWNDAYFIPTGISDIKQYWVYSSLLIEGDERANSVVFLNPSKIMNTVCGLHNNTDREYSLVAPGECSQGLCNATIDGVITNRRYVFNVIVESQRGYMMAYAGLIMRTEWEVIRQATSDKTLKVVGAVSGSVLGMVVIIYFLMLKLYA